MSVAVPVIKLNTFIPAVGSLADIQEGVCRGLGEKDGHRRGEDGHHTEVPSVCASLFASDAEKTEPLLLCTG